LRRWATIVPDEWLPTTEPGLSANSTSPRPFFLPVFSSQRQHARFGHPFFAHFQSQLNVQL